MQEEKVSIVHIFVNPSSTWKQPGVSQTLPQKIKIAQLIHSNSVFLNQHNVEYLVFDNLYGENENILLENINKIEGYKDKKLEYIKFSRQNIYTPKSLKEIFSVGIDLAKNPNIFFIFNNQELNLNNIFEVEKLAPFLKKQDQDIFLLNLPTNFNPSYFRQYMKKNKSILDKLRLLFI